MALVSPAHRDTSKVLVIIHVPLARRMLIACLHHGNAKSGTLWTVLGTVSLVQTVTSSSLVTSHVQRAQLTRTVLSLLGNVMLDTR